MRPHVNASPSNSSTAQRAPRTQFTSANTSTASHPTSLSPPHPVPIHQHSMRAAIFDLDGTLVDSLGDIAASANHAISFLGTQPRTIEEYRFMAGGGNTKLMTLLLQSVLGKEPPSDLVARYVQIKRNYENGPQGHMHTTVFPGVLDMLHALQQAGVQLAILSNKTEPNVRQVVADHLPGIEWKYIAGAREDVPLKPDPTAAVNIMRQHMDGVEVKDCVFVGDTDIDMKTGIAAGMTPIGVSWGFRPVDELKQHGAEIVVETARQISDFVLSRTA